MGGGDEKPPLQQQQQQQEQEGATAAAAATPGDGTESDPVTLEVRPEYTLIAPCGPPLSTGGRAKQDEVMVMARIQAVRETDDARRAPVNICAVIDRSKSMENNIPLVKQSLEFMVQQLREEDQVSFLVFDHEVSTMLPMTHMDLAGKEKASKAIKKLKERGQTNLSGGLLAGLQQFLMMKVEKEEKAKVESVLLFTDGKANRGITNSDTIVQATRSVVGQIGRNVSVFTFGFGEEHEANVLQSVADAGHGLYYFVADVESIPDSFCDCLGGLLSVVAQNIRLEIEKMDDHRLERPLAGFEITSTDPTLYSIQIPDIYSEESKDILVNILLSIKGQFSLDDPTPCRTEVARFRLAYFDVQSCAMRTVEKVAAVDILPPAVTAADLGMEVAERLANPDNDVALQRLRHETNEALRGADQQASSNDTASARQTLQECAQRIERSPFANDPFAQHQRMTLFTAEQSIADKRGYKAYGSKHVRGLAHANMQQRSNTNPIFEPPPSFSSPAASATPLPPPLPSSSGVRRPGRGSVAATASAGAAEGDCTGSSYHAVKAKLNPYRGKLKAEMMARYWDGKRKPPPPPEEE